MTMTLDRPSAAMAEETVAAKRAEITDAETDLRRLREQREQEAITGKDTRGLRQATTDAEADLDDLRMQLGHLTKRLEEESYRQLHRDRHAALAMIYRADLPFLQARRVILQKQAELVRAQGAMQTVIDKIDETRTGARSGFTAADYPLRLRLMGDRALAKLGVEAAPSAPAPIEPLSGVLNNGGETVAEVEADIERITRLAEEAELQSIQGPASDTGIGAGE
jgi:hypothetical protein